MATLFRWPGNWDPFAGLRVMQRELERLSGRGGFGEGRNIGGGVFPPVNVYNGPAELVVECEVAGVKREDVDLSITGETLVVKGVKHPAGATEEKAESDIRYQRCERGSGEFSRTIVLPDKVDPDRISASLIDGILTVRLPKSQAALPKKINVK
ncbi:MAG: Hsp20/alpha crystallin family protein [Phycisphaerae bacterium]|nr:Hsp20/alpha crystallin family protein [Phycisphaerae bacterium]